MTTKTISQNTLPGNRTLIATWATLMALTILAMISAQLGGDTARTALPWWGIVLVLATAGFKVQQILMIYLNLRASSSGWKAGFFCLLIATIILILGAYIAAPLS